MYTIFQSLDKKKRSQKILLYICTECSQLYYKEKEELIQKDMYVEDVKEIDDD